VLKHSNTVITYYTRIVIISFIITELFLHTVTLLIVSCSCVFL